MAVSVDIRRASPILTRPTFSPAATEDVLSGARLLVRAFLNASECSARRGTTIVGADQSDPPLFLIHSGLAYCSTTFAGGRRAITDILLPRDIAGIQNVVMGCSMHTVIAATDLRYRPLSASVVRDLVADNPQIAMGALALAGEVYHRAEQHVVALGRLEARERLSAFLLGIYDRLRGRGLISRPTFNLQLRQDEIADHLGLTAVHVSRTLRSLCAEKLAVVRQHVVIIRDLDGLRAVASGSMKKRVAETSVAKRQRMVGHAARRPETRILLVDDDEIFLESIAAILRSAGYAVRMARDDRLAMDILEGDEPVDLLLADVVLPGRVNGLVLGRMARMSQPNLRTLYVSGYDIHGFEDEGLGTLVRKPVDDRLLLAKIAETLST